MKRRGLSLRETAKLANLSHPTVSDLFNYDKPPSFDTALKLAKVFKADATYVFELAGLIEPTVDNSALVKQIASAVRELSQEDQERIWLMVRALVEEKRT